MPSDGESERSLRHHLHRLWCWIFYHDGDCVREEVLSGGDFVEVEWKCNRCGEHYSALSKYDE